MNSIKRFGVKGKPSPHYIGPFHTLEKCGTVAYKLELPPLLARVHDILHVSLLKKCLKEPMDVVLSDVALLEEDLTYHEHPIQILDQKSRVTRRKMISSSRFNGATIPQKKQDRKVMISSILTIQILNYHSEGTCDCTLSL
jgi:hypothetical protein